MNFSRYACALKILSGGTAPDRIVKSLQAGELCQYLGRQVVMHVMHNVHKRQFANWIIEVPWRFPFRFSTMAAWRLRRVISVLFAEICASGKPLIPRFPWEALFPKGKQQETGSSSGNGQPK
jgi:hypothetical protein